MADFGQDVDGAYDAIREDGGPVKILRPGTAAPDNPDRPWEGSAADVAPFETFAVTLPVQTEGQYVLTAYIPAKGMNFELTEDMQFEDANGVIWQVSNVQLIAPDQVTRILYICEVTQWSGT